MVIEFSCQSNDPKKDIRFDVEVNNFGNTTKYFLSADNDTAIAFASSMYYSLDSLGDMITIYFGSCNEDRFPGLCKQQDFSLFKAIKAKEIKKFKYFVKRNGLINRFNQYAINFTVRYLHEDQLKSMSRESEKSIFGDFFKIAQVYKISINDQKRMEAPDN